ncbi:Crp/Fnr family transcriptional regulator [Methylobacterium sp. 092160098-2]|jgi:CRP-like cAMP-binding protein|uniref:Crp/Fnr family transcriptional regulator n=1 Tax=Methylobacterium sp. 092160098-2 TaxID=3025129 RepID=UPI002381C968|nr:Crp/Fnr family transcriptional regulator [Methylobacterium sp. 092160098-2]MDE4914732.1 Crp/Fnr family transcriptional regulator [Methylobacterium sp. 092160098-2]
MLTDAPLDRSRADILKRLQASVVRRRSVAPRRAISSDARVAHLHLVISGLAARYRVLGNGSRQITELYLPGDLCDLGYNLNGRAGDDVVALSACILGEIPRKILFTDSALSPDWAEFLFRAVAREGAIATERIVSLGRRSAYEAAAHLFCELWARMNAVGLADETSFPFDLTQVDLADVLGMTSVHVNRTLRELRTRGLVRVRGKVATILDHGALAQAADFDPTYLQMHEALSAPARSDSQWYERSIYHQSGRGPARSTRIEPIA